jgi:hypothetical protein
MQTTEPIPVATPTEQPIRYREAYRYITTNAEWLAAVGWGALCHLSQLVVPFIGPLVYTGYQFEIVESLHRDSRRTYPTFDIHRFADYLVRGLWPFLVQLLFGFVVMGGCTLLGFFGSLAVILGFATISEEVAALGVLLAVVLVSVGMMLATFVLQVVVMPFVIQAGLSQSLSEAFDVGRAVDFIRRTFKELVLVALFLMVTLWGLLLVGMLIFCVGMYLAFVPWMLAQAHLYYQLYHLYLARGGRPIPLKPQPPLPA